ncbi:alpha/beta hydrolase family esterase [Paracoccaceae bacterium GXU_MW_L88]
MRRAEQAEKPAAPANAPQLDGVVKGKYQGPEGSRRYYLTLPDSGRADVLIVMLHGCTQTAADFMRATGMSDQAGARGVAVLWPEQTRTANTMRCWNWFEPDQKGETDLLFALIEDVQGRYGLGSADLCIGGLSAGGTMAATLAAARPEAFAALGVHSGVMPGSAGGAREAFSVMRNGSGDTPPVLPPMIVFHGMDDNTVIPENGAELAARISGPREDGHSEGYDWHKTVGRKGEYWQIDGMGHAWSGAPENGPHADPQGPDATAEMLRFFLKAVSENR